MKEQTAVEWLEDNLIGNPFSEKDFSHNVNVFKQAKAMEKEQRNKDYNAGYTDAQCNHINDCENYGNEQEYLTNQEFDDSDQFGLKTPMH
jgi:hypothetical protein